MSDLKSFPEGMTPLANTPFTFNCHPGVSCFTVCCRKVDLTLYPYDIICLKNRLGIDSEEFLSRYTSLVRGNNPYFPTLMLALTEAGKGCCPFLDDQGCTVYESRPTDCRTYPLERAVARNPGKGRPREYYFLVKHDYCAGHEEADTVTAREYIRSQKLDRYNTMNELWTEIDTLFMNNPWKGEGAGGPGQQLAFMVCYNIDGFRRLANERRLLDQFKLARARKREIEVSDEELLKFGFDWLKMLFGGKSSLLRR